MRYSTGKILCLIYIVVLSNLVLMKHASNPQFSCLVLWAPKIMNPFLLSFTINSFFLKKRMSLAILFSRCNFDSEIIFPLQKIKVSSAYLIILEFTPKPSFVSFTYILKSSGPSTAPKKETV